MDWNRHAGLSIGVDWARLRVMLSCLFSEALATRMSLQLKDLRSKILQDIYVPEVHSRDK